MLRTTLSVRRLCQGQGRDGGANDRHLMMAIVKIVAQQLQKGGARSRGAEASATTPLLSITTVRSATRRESEPIRRLSASANVDVFASNLNNLVIGWQTLAGSHLHPFRRVSLLRYFQAMRLSLGPRLTQIPGQWYLRRHVLRCLRQLRHVAFLTVETHVMLTQFYRLCARLIYLSPCV